MREKRNQEREARNNNSTSSAVSSFHFTTSSGFPFFSFGGEGVEVLEPFIICAELQRKSTDHRKYCKADKYN